MTVPVDSVGSMGDDNQRTRPLPAAVAGAVVGAWYALPDYVDSRRARALAKAALFTGGGALYVLASRTADDAPRNPTPATENQPTTEDAGAEAEHSAGWQRLAPRVQLAVVAGAFAAFTVVSIAGERLVYCTGERLANRGVRRPHTLIGLALGALTALTTPSSAPAPSSGNRFA